MEFFNSAIQVPPHPLVPPGRGGRGVGGPSAVVGGEVTPPPPVRPPMAN